MSNHSFSKIELVGTSEQSLEAAIQNAVSMAAKTVKNMRWFEVVETRGSIDGDKVRQWQVTIKVGASISE